MGYLTILLLLAAAPPVGDIEFFGYSDLDLAKVRAALPVHEGDAFSEHSLQAVRAAIVKATGKAATDVEGVCCDPANKMLIYIGLPGASYHAFAYNPAPTGRERLSSQAMKLHSQFDQALQKAVRKGGDATAEDDSLGYAQYGDPALKKIQMNYRIWALQHDKEILAVLGSSASVADRRVASEAAGYSRQSKEQILALVKAARDPDGEVRNNATRALGVLVRSDRNLAAEIPAETFIEMLSSGVWTDRNKAAALLMALTDDRDPALLQKIRAHALDALIEMATWREAGHAWFARILLGRIAGIPEDNLRVMASKGSEEIVKAVK